MLYQSVNWIGPPVEIVCLSMVSLPDSGPLVTILRSFGSEWSFYSLSSFYTGDP